jgi:GDP-L-fucose synthase
MLEPCLTPFTFGTLTPPLWGFHAKKKIHDFKIVLNVLFLFVLICVDAFTVDERDEVSIRQLAEMVVSACGYKGNLDFDTSQADGQFKKTASNAKLRSLLPEFKFTPFDVALRETVEWYSANWQQARH